jgi:hypothetical protein
VLGYLFFAAMSAAEEATTTYNDMSGQLTRLQNEKITRNQKNLQALTAQKDEAVLATKDFQSLLSKWSFPFEDMSPEQFQDRLRKARTALIERGGAVTTFPKEKFFLGFDEYENQPPSKEAVPALGRELKAIDWLCNGLIDAKVAELVSIKRDKIAEETAKPATPAAPGAKPGGPGGGGGAKPRLLTANGIDLDIHCTQKALGIFLNSLVDSKVPQFYVIRYISIKNEKDKVAKTQVLDGPVAVADAGKGGYFLGEEMLNVSLRMEIVDFAEPAPATPK